MSSVGIDVGGTKLLAVRIGDDGAVLGEHRVATPDDGTQLVAAMTGAFHALAAGEKVTSCGVGIAGLIEHDSGVFVWGPHVAGRDVPVKSELEAQLEVPVAVDNDANAAALAEHLLGAGRESVAMLLVTVGTGIGGAMVCAGSVYRGRGFAGEVGHVPLTTGDRLCACGLRGCWETEAAGLALERMAGELIESDPAGSLAAALGSEPVTGPAISAAAASGDLQAKELIGRIGRAIGDGLAGLISIFDPDRVVIGGGLATTGELLLEPIRRRAHAARFAATHRRLPPIVAAALGEHSGAVGAALLARNLVRAG